MKTISEWIGQIEAGGLDGWFERLYGRQPGVAEQQRLRYTEALRGFRGQYGEARAVSLYSTPGRTEIGGNHTDHNNGLVMAGAVTLDIIAVAAKNDDNMLRVKSQGFPEDVVDLARLEPVVEEKGRSASMLRGVAAGLRRRGGSVGGFDAYTTSDVLAGSGLSSSAAFEVCLSSILNYEYNEGRFSAVELAQVSQYAENAFFGKPSGLMDQTACAVGGAITIDFANPEQPVVESIPFDLDRFGYRLVVTDTKGSHANLTAEYAAIREEMESVAAHFGKRVLREVTREELLAGVPALREACGDRAVLRALHFMEECRRVPLLAEAIRAGDIGRFLAFIREGGASSVAYNQNAFSVTAPREQGIMLALALSQLVLEGEGAWRLQGGGFAGTIQAFVPEGKLAAYTAMLSGVFGSDACYVLGLRPDGCIRLDG